MGAWADTPIDATLMNEVLEILKPIHNWFYIEGRPENNDSLAIEVKLNDKSYPAAVLRPSSKTARPQAARRRI